jgi:hypothetical protein
MNPRERLWRGRLRSVAVAVGGLVLVLVGLIGPVYGAGPLGGTPLASTAVGGVEPPSLPVPVPSVAVPTLPPLPTIRPTLPPLPTIRPTLPPLPTPTLPPLPTPTLPPLPTPTLPPLPTPTLPNPPSLPVPSASPTPTSGSGTPTASDAGASGAGQGGASAPPGGAASGPADPSSSGNIPVGGPVGPQPSLAPVLTDGPSAAAIPSIGELIVPGLLVGIPLFTLLLILAGQVGVGAAWLPVVRRWLTRPLVPGRERPAADLPAHGPPGDQLR